MNDFSDDVELLDAINNGELIASAQVLAVLQELSDMLSVLSERGEKNCIDIRSLPFAPMDREFLLKFLGRGEVSANVNTLGLSEIKETRFSGIWLLTHYNAHAEIIAELIEVTLLPDILMTQAADTQQSVDALSRYLQRLQSDD